MSDAEQVNSSIFTVCSIGYLPKALVLAESVHHLERRRLIVFLVDRKQELPQITVPVDIRWIEDEHIDDFERLAFMYDVTELTTSVKPMLTLKLLEKSQTAIFFDPDTCLFSNLDPVFALLNRYPIVVTPHYTTPIDRKEADYDLDMMRFGSFNLGFFAVTREAEAVSFLSWWSVRCRDLCFFESQFGLSTDQKWVTIAPCFFPHLHISFDKGLNMAFWNLHERALSKRSDGYWVNEEDKLVFFHFSAFDMNRPESVSTREHPWKNSGRDDVAEICAAYAERLRTHDLGFSKINYGFDYLSDGTYISPTLRRAYAAIADELGSDVNPFAADGAVKTFARRNHLIQGDNTAYRAAKAKDLTSHQGKFAAVNFFLRLILRFIGPNNFYNLSRLFVFLSSYRQNRALWKL